MDSECSKFQSMIEPFLDDQLSGADREAFIMHVNKCKACKDELEVFHVIFSVVSQLDGNSDDLDLDMDYKASLDRKLKLGADNAMRLRMIRYIIEVILGIAIVVLLCLVFK